MAIVGVILVIASHYGLNLDESATAKIAGLIASYIVGQGLADFGKEAQK
jgi:hypothetical protein